MSSTVRYPQIDDDDVPKISPEVVVMTRGELGRLLDRAWRAGCERGRLESLAEAIEAVKTSAPASSSVPPPNDPEAHNNTAQKTSTPSRRPTGRRSGKIHAVMRAISGAPAQTVREISEATGLKFGTVSAYCSMFDGSDLISEQRPGEKMRRYSLSEKGQKRVGKNRAIDITKGVARTILHKLVDCALPVSMICAETGLKPGSVSSCCSSLTKQGMLSASKPTKDTPTNYMATDKAKLIMNNTYKAKVNETHVPPSNPQTIKSRLIGIAGKIVTQTTKAYRFSDGSRTVWLPKSMCVWLTDACIMTIPEWKAKEVGLV